MTDLCKNCSTYKSFGFSPACKYCPNDGHCPECGERLRLGEDLNGPFWICPNGHFFGKDGKEWFNPSKRYRESQIIWYSQGFHTPTGYGEIRRGKDAFDRFYCL